MLRFDKTAARILFMLLFEMIRKLKRSEFFGKTQGVRSDSHLVLSETLYPPRSKAPKHSHELPYFTLLIEGSYEETYRSGAVTYEPFSVVYHPRDEVHFGHSSPQGARCFNIELRQDLLDPLQELAPPEGTVDRSGGTLNWLAVRIFAEYLRADASSPLAVESLVYEMLAEAGRAQIHEKRPPVWLRRAIDLLHAEYREPLKLGDIAGRVGVHPVHLSRVFRRFHHLSVGEYVRRLRVRFACQELQGLSVRLADLACEAGFADQSQLTRAFKEITGTTPARFRRLVGFRQDLSFAEL